MLYKFYIHFLVIFHILASSFSLFFLLI